MTFSSHTARRAMIASSAALLCAVGTMAWQPRASPAARPVRARPPRSSAPPVATSSTAAPGRDVVVTLGGNDDIDAGGGDDLICAGGGNDEIDGDAGNDMMYGQGGNDEMDGQIGNDMLIGGKGTDDADGEAGTDTCKAEIEDQCEA